MDIKRGSQPHHARIRRLGKKAIFYGRIANVLGVAQPRSDSAAPSFASSMFKRIGALRPTRKQLIASACAVVLAITGVIANSLYQSQRAAVAKAAAKAENERIERVNAAAQECYKKKITEKQKMLGKVTFDQLYDGDSCIASQ